ncbi:Dyp-type peroxidase [Paludisphaera rhizosphaerae]|uniref:Dyp-type peroxidase n=1 Tax=Paludisphaera rhizosphaerae TaxID=2711216 RepID=UPI0013EB858A|nr:Dyp-type peroxidase [Paludisphaera rhizosphaerae]
MDIQEETLEAEEIQGNILGGFNKDFQAFLFLRLPATPPGVASVRPWLRQLAPQVSTLAEVAHFNGLYKSMRRRLGFEPKGLVATWMNLAFSAAALRSLTSPAEVEQFADQHFKDGLQTRSGDLGDPTDAAAEGHPDRWVVGGPGLEADMLIIVASDSPDLLASRLDELKSTMPSSIEILWEQPGQTLESPLVGHEHFGFNDGVSQPGIRGLLQTIPPVPLTPRLIDPQQSPQPDPRQPEYAAPGRPLIWPGQFVFGYRRQSIDDPRKPPAALVPDPTNPPADPFALADACPAWARNGSFLVLRRLRQDVPAFRAFVRAAAATLAGTPGFSGMTATRFASMCVGRWPSGSPIMRSPTTENLALAADPHADNYFQFVRDSPPPLVLSPDLGYAGDTFPLSRLDDKGVICPFSAHIRKVNPRDTITEQGSFVDTLTRLVLRRGIPYGPAYPGDLDRDDPSPHPELAAVDRGLIFVCYQTSIEEQFAFLQTSWANDTKHPNGQGGHDPIIGQDRSAGGARFLRVRAADQPSQTVSVPTDWVIPTGGGYFFSPSISTLVNVLGAVS